MQLASERETLPGFTREGPGGMVPVAVGEMAVHVLRNMAWDSDRARAGLISVLSTIALSKEFCEWLNPAKLLGDEFRPPATGKRVSKRAKSTE